MKLPALRSALSVHPRCAPQSSPKRRAAPGAPLELRLPRLLTRIDRCRENFFPFITGTVTLRRLWCRRGTDWFAGGICRISDPIVVIIATVFLPHRRWHVASSWEAASFQDQGLSHLFSLSFAPLPLRRARSLQGPGASGNGVSRAAGHSRRIRGECQAFLGSRGPGVGVRGGELGGSDSGLDEAMAAFDDFGGLICHCELVWCYGFVA